MPDRTRRLGNTALIIAAVAIGAAMKGQSAIPKYVVLAGVLCAVIGGIGSAITNRGQKRT